jgi:hypothetical protein
MLPVSLPPPPPSPPQGVIIQIFLNRLFGEKVYANGIIRVEISKKNIQEGKQKLMVLTSARTQQLPIFV